MTAIPAVPGNHHSTLGIYDFDYCTYLTGTDSESFIFVWLASFTEYNVLEAHSCCNMWQNFRLFLSLSNNPLRAYITFCLSIHSSLGAPPFSYCESGCQEYGRTKISLSSCLHFSWLYTQKWNSWFILCLFNSLWLATSMQMKMELV